MKSVHRRTWLKWTGATALARSFPSCERPRGARDFFDVVIIGGGLAGLTAAVILRDRRLLLLERSPRLGGRVQTKRRAGVNYEMGALMAYDPSVVPFSHQPSRLIRGAGPIGLSLAGTTRLESTPEQLVNSLERSVYPPMACERKLSACRDKVEAAFFSVIHPGDRSRYIEARRDDWKSVLRFDHFEAGNGELVSELRRRMVAELRLESTAVRLKVLHDHVEITYQRHGRDRTCAARVAIVAAPAPTAARLLGQHAPTWLTGVRYGSGVVLTLALVTNDLRPFSYVVTPDLSMNCVIATVRGQHPVLTIYFSGEHATKIESLSGQELVKLVLRDLALGDIGRLEPHQILFSDVQAWPNLGPIIGRSTYGAWSSGRQRPLPGVFLAGDYTCWDSEKLPYGMSAAIKSGESAGRAVLRFLAEQTWEPA